MTSVSSAAAAHLMRNRLGELRREVGRMSLQVFAKTYLPAHFNVPSSSMHVGSVTTVAGRP